MLQYFFFSNTLFLHNNHIMSFLLCINVGNAVHIYRID